MINSFPAVNKKVVSFLDFSVIDYSPTLVGTRVTRAKCVLRVGAAEDKEGASLWDGSDLLLLHQVGDDRPRSRRNLRVVLLAGRIVLLILLANRAAGVRTRSCTNRGVKVAGRCSRIPSHLCRHPFCLCKKDQRLEQIKAPKVATVEILTAAEGG